MASARTLSAAELGANRYNQANNSNKWPIKVHLPYPQSNHHIPPSTYILILTNHPEESPIPFQYVTRNHLIINVSISPGWLQYQIHRSDQQNALVATGGLDVVPPSPPLSTLGGTLISLTQRPPSGVQQLQNSVKNNDTHSIKFVYQEAIWAARQVFVVIEKQNDNIQYPLERDLNGSFHTIISLNSGAIKYRFRVIPTENTKAQAAPFTRLGWDDSAAQNHSELYTWPFIFTIHKDGHLNGESVIDNKSTKKRIRINDNHQQKQVVLQQPKSSHLPHTEDTVDDQDVCCEIQKKNCRNKSISIVWMGLLAGVLTISTIFFFKSQSNEKDEDDQQQNDESKNNRFSVFKYSQGLSS